MFQCVLELRPQVGGIYAHSWSVFSATQIRQHGLWCQVGPSHTAGMGSNVGNFFYTIGNEPTRYTVVPTSDTNNSVPYQQLKCANQIGLVVDGDVTSHQGVITCITAIPNLNSNTNSWIVYSDDVYNNYNESFIAHCV